MNIITAKEAREKSDYYVNDSINPTVDYVMQAIKDSYNYGCNYVTFYSFVPIIYFETMKSDNFVKFIKSLGYNYKFTMKKLYGEYEEEITISW